MPELKLHYTTVGEPTGQPVLVLHGSGGSAASMLTPTFAGELFGPGQPLDAAKYYIIIPDSIGHGQSSKPSDGMKTAFPKYDYADMVDAQYRLVTEGLGIKHLRLVIGNSMGGMHTWLWGVRYPHFMDALVPMASQPTEMAARNWMLRRIMLETIRNDPDYNGGNYTSQPRMMKYAIAAYRHRQRRRHARLSDAGADGGESRQDGRRAAGNAGPRRRQRLHLPVGSLARLQPIRRAGEDRGDACWRSTPPMTNAIRRRPASPTAAMKRIKNGQLYLIPASTRDARPPHHRQREILCRAVEGIAADRAAADHVRMFFAPHQSRARPRSAQYLSVHPRRGSGLIALNRRYRRARRRSDERCESNAVEDRMRRFAQIVLLACCRGRKRGARLRQRAIRQRPGRHPRLVQGRDGAERRALLRYRRRPSHRI